MSRSVESLIVRHRFHLASFLCVFALIFYLLSKYPIATDGSTRTMSKLEANLVTMDVWNFWPETKSDLTTVSWSHAVNSKEKLALALKAVDVMMLEADVSSGTVSEIRAAAEEPIAPIPIMAHPPATISDLSLDVFLQSVLKASSNSSHRRGIKLDFKDIGHVEGGFMMLKQRRHELSHIPFWINADLVPGPGLDDQNMLENSDLFLQLCQQHFPHSTLSIGWKRDTKKEHLKLTRKHVDNLIALLVRNGIVPDASRHVTVATWASLVKGAEENLLHLVKELGAGATITFWSNPGDKIDVESLANFILVLGTQKVFLDLPKEEYMAVRNKLIAH